LPALFRVERKIFFFKNHAKSCENNENYRKIFAKTKIVAKNFRENYIFKVINNCDQSYSHFLGGKFRKNKSSCKIFAKLAKTKFL
jgi:hypothetical protein